MTLALLEESLLSRKHHQVVLHHDFLSRFNDIPIEVKEDMGFIIEGLTRNAFFTPLAEEYVVEKEMSLSDPAKNRVVCRKINGWGSWTLAWFLEYEGNYGPFDDPRRVVVTAIQAPLPIRLEPLIS